MQKQIKAIIFLFIILLFGSLTLIQPVFAEIASNATAQNQSAKNALDFLDNTAEKSGLVKTNNAQTSLIQIIGNIVNVLLGFIGIIFFIQIFWSGFRWMTASGNEEVIKEAKETIKTAIIGIIIVFSAFMLTNFILNKTQTVTTTVAQP